MSRMAVIEDSNLIAKINLGLGPLKSNQLLMLAGVVIEHPNHVVSIEGDGRWLALRHPEATQ